MLFVFVLCGCASSREYLNDTTFQVSSIRYRDSEYKHTRFDVMSCIMVHDGTIRWCRYRVSVLRVDARRKRESGKGNSEQVE